MSAVAPRRSSGPSRVATATPVKRQAPARKAPASQRRVSTRTASRPGTADRPALRVVPARRPFAGALAIVLVVVFLAMLGLTSFQTRMAQQQVRIDQLQAEVDLAKEEREVLLRRRAELRAPQRLAVAAEELGMKQADAVSFVEVDPDVYAEVLAASGALPASEVDAGSIADPATEPGP